jgi:hypothetical protein
MVCPCSFFGLRKINKFKPIALVLRNRNGARFDTDEASPGTNASAEKLCQTKEFPWSHKEDTSCFGVCIPGKIGAYFI